MLRRLVLAVPLLAAISLVGFMIMQSAPGDPFADLLLNPNIHPAEVERIRKAWGLDRPLWEQYLRWSVAWVRGDWGYSLRSGDSVRQMIGQALPNGLILLAASLCVALPLAIGYGLATYRAHNRFTRFLEASSRALMSTPNFVIGLVFIHVFAERARWFPSANMYSVHGSHMSVDLLHHLVLPAATLALPIAAGWGQVYRAALQNIAEQPHVWGALSRGLPPRWIVWRHIMRNAWAPLFAIVALDMPAMLTGAVIVETLFAWPGLGRLYVVSASARDYPVLMGILMLAALCTVAANITADFVIARLDPRINQDDEGREFA